MIEFDKSKLFRAQKAMGIQQYDKSITLERVQQIFSSHNIEAAVREGVVKFVNRIINKEEDGLNKVLSSSTEKEKVFKIMYNALGHLLDVCEKDKDKAVIIFSQINEASHKCTTGYTEVLTILYFQYFEGKTDYIEDEAMFKGYINNFIENYKRNFIDERLAQYLNALKSYMVEGAEVHIKNYVYKKLVADGILADIGLVGYEDNFAEFGAMGEVHYNKFLEGCQMSFNLHALCGELKEGLKKQSKFFYYIATALSDKVEDKDMGILATDEDMTDLYNAAIVLLLHHLEYIEIKNIKQEALSKADVETLEFLLKDCDALDVPIECATEEEVNEAVQEAHRKESKARLVLSSTIGFISGCGAGGAVFSGMYFFEAIKDISATSSTALTLFCEVESNLAIADIGALITILPGVLIGSICICICIGIEYSRN